MMCKAMSPQCSRYSRVNHDHHPAVAALMPRRSRLAALQMSKHPSSKLVLSVSCSKCSPTRQHHLEQVAAFLQPFLPRPTAARVLKISWKASHREADFLEVQSVLAVSNVWSLQPERDRNAAYNGAALAGSSLMPCTSAVQLTAAVGMA